MAQWIKLPDNSTYIAIVHVDILSISADDATHVFIAAHLDSGTQFRVRGPFASIADAQAALDNAVINNLGGSF